MKKRLLTALCVIVGLICLPAAATLAEPHLPMTIRQQYRLFSYTYLSVAPTNKEPYGVYVVTPFAPDAEIRVAFCDGGERHTYGLRPGGDDFRRATLQKFFNLRVNAPNSREAERLLREYLAAHGFRGSVREVCFFGHGDIATPLLGLYKVGDELLKLLSELKPASGLADLYFVNCSVAEGAEGRAYIHGVADNYGLRINASEDTIGWMLSGRTPDGKANYQLGKESWLVASSHESELKREDGASAN